MVAVLGEGGSRPNAVAEKPVLVVSGCAKLLVGDLVERARKARGPARRGGGGGAPAS